jgi:ferric iron reductase protein FhuF
MTQAGGLMGLSTAFAGPHAWCNEKMMLSGHLSDGIPLPDFFAAGGFERALIAYEKASGGSDRRAVASMWSLYYFSSLTIPYVVARVLDHQALPVAFDEMTVALSADGLPRALGVTAPGDRRTDGEDEILTLLAPLMDEHLAKMVGYLKAVGGISPKLAWNNAAVYIDYALRTAGTDDRPSPEAQWRAQPLLRLSAPRGGRRNARLPPQDLLPSLSPARGSKLRQPLRPPQPKESMTC